MSKLITTSFINNSNAPQTGLIPKIRIRDLSNNLLVITDENMSEVGDGSYKYNFLLYDPSKEYMFRCDANVGIIARYTFGSTGQDTEDEILNIPTNPLLTSDSRLNHLDATISSRATASSIVSMQSDVTDIKSDVNDLLIDIDAIIEIESGRWKIDAVTKQMIFYKSDNVTEIMRFNLLDALGVASTDSIFERVKV